MSQFQMGWNPLWVWVCSVLDPQDAINELIKCVLRVVGQENGGLMWTTTDNSSGRSGWPGNFKEMPDEAASASSDLGKGLIYVKQTLC